MAIDETELRQRNVPQQAASAENAGSTVRSLNTQESQSDKPESDKKTFGRTPDGIVFTVPETKDMVGQLLSPTEPKNIGDIVVVSILVLHGVLLYLLPSALRVPVFALIYFFWRASYNAGIGYLLYEQSNYKRLVRWAKKYKLFEKENNPRPWLYQFIKREMEIKIPKDYNFDDAPVEFNTWLVFRRLTDLILMSDFITYCLFAIAATNNPPPGESLIMGFLRWTAGIGLVLFNLWVKLDAHRVVKDYAWYWGDFFFLVDQELTFDGVFEMAPHPMYSVGYAGFYGISLMAASYKVLFISIVAHAAQFAFLVWVENPHIEKTYNAPAPSKRLLEDTEASGDDSGDAKHAPPLGSSEKPSPVHNVLGLHNVDFFRLLDTSAFLLNTYMFLFTVLTPSTFWYQALFVVNAALWRVWYSLGLGYILNRQSTKKNWTRHFVKYGESTEEAWRQWRGLYHLSMTMTYASFIAAVWKVYEFPSDWAHGHVLLNHVLGVSLVALQIWTAVSIYEELGEFGWFFGDFFFDQASKLTYSGIYRFLNNPERVIGLAGVWGAALVTRSTAIVFLALLSHAVSLIFIQFVERPHMQKLYGEKIREDSGLSKSLKRSLPPPLRKWQSTVDKMLDESFDYIEDFIDAARPKITAGVDTFVKDSTGIFKHPARLTITRLEPDMAGYDPKDYSLEVLGGTQSKDGKGLSFAYGQPIRVKWTAPLNHSPLDWVGLYSVSDNASWSVTKVGSAGRWCATNPEQHDDDPTPGIGVKSSDIRVSGVGRKDGETKDYYAGELEFSSDKLFWKTGGFEFRYHHNGKHNVMAISRAFEVRIDRFDEDDVEVDDTGAIRGSVEQALLPLVRNCMDRDPQVAPETVSQGFGTLIVQNGKYSKRVVYAISQMFGIEFAPGVVQADGNVKNLAWRICNAKKVLVSNIAG